MVEVLWFTFLYPSLFLYPPDEVDNFDFDTSLNDCWKHPNWLGLDGVMICLGMFDTKSIVVFFTSLFCLQIQKLALLRKS